MPAHNRTPRGSRSAQPPVRTTRQPVSYRQDYPYGRPAQAHAARGSSNQVPGPSRASRGTSPRAPRTPRTPQRSGPSARTVGFVVAAVVAVLAVVYCIGCVYFSSHFLPNTTLGVANVSFMTAERAREAVAQEARDVAVGVAGQGVSFTVTGQNAGLQIDPDATVAEAMTNNASWRWPVQLFMPGKGAYEGTLDTAALRATVESGVAAHNALATDPVDAHLAYDAAFQRFVVDPGTPGTKLDVDLVMEAVMEALVNHQHNVALTSEHLAQQKVSATEPRLFEAQKAANAFLACNLDFTVYGNLVATVNPDVVHTWVSVGEDFSVWIDDAKLVAWVDTVESIVDTVGDARTYTRPDGKVVTVSGGTYGWVSDGTLMDQYVRDAVYNGTVGQQEVPFYQYGESYNPGGQDWGLRYVDVDITEQYARFYDYDGTFVMGTPIITGSTLTEGTETPQGVYSITRKAMNQTLIGLEDPETGKPLYETPVTYWMPFIGDAIGLHDAGWQYEFGGNLYQMGLGSHGCVNLPPNVAEWAYSWINVGDVVVTHY